MIDNDDSNYDSLKDGLDNNGDDDGDNNYHVSMRWYRTGQPSKF